MKHDARIAKLERQADEAEQRKMEEIMGRIRTHDQGIVFFWYLTDDLATDVNLPPSELAEIVAKRDRSEKAINEKEATEPGYLERVTAELKTLGVL